MKILDLPNFKHKSPKNYYYEIEEFKRNVYRIWLCNTYEFDYNLGKQTRSVWGFFNSKKSKYFSPVNSKTVGKEVQIQNTTPWSSMPIFQTPLESAFK